MCTREKGHINLQQLFEASSSNLWVSPLGICSSNCGDMMGNIIGLSKEFVHELIFDIHVGDFLWALIASWHHGISKLFKSNEEFQGEKNGEA
jgi:hypothetical protein